MSGDVTKFLEEVKQLGDRRIHEDEARTRQLEEKILQEKKERQARRAERARSISPQKSSPANTPPPSAQRTSIQGSASAAERLNLESSPSLEPPTSPPSFSSSPQPEEMAARSPFSASPTKENESPFSADNKPQHTSPTRSGSVARGLSWQKRPNSQASGGSRSRPLSMVAAENAARSSTTPSDPTSATEPISRDQIASALSGKDPSWFRQTADRGASSAAYRRTQVEDSPTADMSAIRSQLPGMSRSPSAETKTQDPTFRSGYPGLRSNMASPMHLSSVQKLDPPNDDQPDPEDAQEKPAIMSPPLGRSSPTRADRPASPTKGMGGFVQSAMMKRSDSVNKRWSVKSPAGLQRADSVASNRSSFEPLNRPSADAISRPSSLGREPSNEAASRPSSSQGRDDHSSEVPSLSRLDTQTLPESTEQELADAALPVSPSKTMDSRRWSPTKGSWLESALNKPESPKPKATPAVSNQPSWMAELQKARAEKAANPSAERSRSPTISHKHQVSIGGLMRSSAPGTGTRPAVSGSLHSPSPSISSRPGSGPTAKDSQSSAIPVAQMEPKISPKIREENKPTSPPPTTSNKPKPETPPKKDFRANLKPRSIPSTSSDANEPEFKNVFGNLRKTTTQNYVAPDELKNNILRGKEGLNITGGPKKTERKDEFKEAILAKKKEFQQVQTDGRGIKRNDSAANDKPVPEGLARFNTLGRANTVKRASATSETTATDSKRSSATSIRDSAQERATDRLERSQNIEKRESKPELPLRSDRPNLAIRRDSTQETTAPKHVIEPSPSQKESSLPGRLPGKIGGSVLANRFNPALAGLLARGPPGMGPGPAGSASGTSSSTAQSSAPDEVNDNEAGSGPKLTHMTKGRARGPKRKAPSSATSGPATASPEEPKKTTPAPNGEDAATAQAEPRPSPVPAAAPEAMTLVDSSEKSYNEPQRPRPQPISLSGSLKHSFDSTSEIPYTRTPRSSNNIEAEAAAFAVQRRQRSPTKSAEESNETISQPSSPRKLDLKRMSRFMDESKESVSKTAEPEKSREVKSKPDSPPITKPKPASPISARSQPQSPPLAKTPRPLPDPTALPPEKEQSNIALESNKATPMPSARPLPQPPTHATVRSGESPIRPLSLGPRQTPRPLPSPGRKSPSTIPSPLRSPTKQSLDISTTLSDFFGPERPRRDYNVDTAEILLDRPNLAPPKIQTLSAQLFQFSGDGKKQPVPAHHERVLFEREMYLCSHTFRDEADKKTSEVYFWAGDEVPQATVEDASLFVSREARAMGGKLVRVQQGKETAEFLQALGGIVITQRGSGNKFDSLAPHMLCGRRYQGHVVFDEVDFTPAALCSGFPYLVTQAGRCYLWKGKGSGVDELSCARLIGMDYALSGEMEEVEDGREPADFWDVFDGGHKIGSADHWRLKPNYDKYCSRLFHSNAVSKQQIVELSPFSQADLQPTGIYILDAFFELYIVVGSQAQPQYASFHNALDFAQEYAILSAGMEDRPFVPVSTVVLEGIPRDLKSVFRKWRDASSPTLMNTNPSGLKRGRSLKVVGLNQALQALCE
ncbi:hypothetical protein F4778DRAFT_741573 [Xylariomycetidae sp. FL2044]|nr:hypothetical protein F4778DRAFT_741573 [Xylariomycetidae sp. FL2044]